MAAGPLGKRVTIQKRSLTTDSYGQGIESFSDGATVWASIEPLRGAEAATVAQVDAELTHKVMIRGGQTVTVKDRLKYGSRIFEINEVKDLKERGVFVELMCREALA